MIIYLVTQSFKYRLNNTTVRAHTETKKKKKKNHKIDLYTFIMLNLYIKNYASALKFI